ncbi:QcrA and Rieske domain-containing protein [Hippea jasoniae]|uniref:QcrA and Rieske domain-containing protein n=1 Tax=Hippea jasoniae TaxID=944479 RepID=UPI00068BB52E|nr:ubiquinol-cytochrome c reductase iron-sulfur subunit [Hippea jasoniae]
MSEKDRKLESSCEACVHRRKILKGLIGVAGLGASLGFLASFGTIKPEEKKKGRRKINKGDKLVFAVGDMANKVITVDSLPVGKGTLAYPKGKEDHDNLILLFHAKYDEFEKPTKLKFVTKEGFAAYSAICTHMGCTVEWYPNKQFSFNFPHLFCPCHQSVFDVFHGAKVLAGPAPRPLPQLPIMVANNEIVAAGDFDGPIGPLPGGK